MEKSEPLMTADGFYEKNVGSVSFLYASFPEGRFFMSMSFVVVAFAGVVVELMLCVRVMAQEVVFP